MTSIYFPFTTLLPNVAVLLNACFSKIVVYRIAETLFESHPASLQDNGSIRIRMPVSGDEERLAAVLKEYKNWADIHDEKAAAFLKTQDQIPFYSDTSVSKIRTDLKDRIIGRQRGKNGESPVDDTFVARLFLALAQEHDSYMAGVIDDLIAIDQIEKDLYDRLKGEPEDLTQLPLSGSKSATDLGAHMTAERIRSWSLLFLKDTEEFGVFVTDSQSVLNHLVDADTGAGIDIEPLFTLASIPVPERRNPDTEAFHRTICQLLDGLAANSRVPESITLPERAKPGQGEKTVSLDVHVAWGIHPRRFFSRFASGKDGLPKVHLPSLFQNTVICLIRKDRCTTHPE